MATLTETKVVALLGRPLSEIEHTNFELYLNIAKLRLNDLICDDLDDMKDLPDDLALVWARLFGVIELEQNSAGGVTQKRVEDFSISYDTEFEPLADVIDQNSTTIMKYSKCGGIRHGRTIYDDGLHCV